MMTPKHPSESLTVLTDLVLPSETNALNNLFGGELLARMDRAACISAGRHSRQQHQHARRRQNRRLHQASTRRDWHALLQPRQRDEAARSRARCANRQRCVGHGDGHRQKDQEDLGRLGRLRWFHR